MVNKIEWYKNNSYEIVENGGNLILTYYSNESNFIKDVANYLSIIETNKYT